MYNEENKKRSLKVVFQRESVKVQKISDQLKSAAAAGRP